MKPVDQTQFAARPAGEAPPKEAGNCLAAAIASVIERPLADIPNFAAMPGSWYKATERWLIENGYGVVVLYPETQPAYPWWATLGMYVLGHGKSPRGEWWHTVVYEVGEDGLLLAHDPHHSRAGLDGGPQELWFLVPIERWTPSEHSQAIEEER